MNRSGYIDLSQRKVLLSKISGSAQEYDITLPTNCNGFGRIRNFKRDQGDDWIEDPLPIDPAARHFNKLDKLSEIKAQVFQLAFCNMNCWYCFVPDEIKNGIHGEWFDVPRLLDLFAQEKDIPQVIDLSGGNPELTPEWVLWFMEELEKRNLQKKFYLWSDDTLSTDSMFQFLNKKQIEYMANYKGYGKVCCFKGFDENSYTFNSSLSGSLFSKQFERIKQYFDLGFDTYGYVTITTNVLHKAQEKISNFMDKLQTIHDFLPLKVIPLKIIKFTPTQTRVGNEFDVAIHNQKIILDIWKYELSKRFSLSDMKKNIVDLR